LAQAAQSIFGRNWRHWIRRGISAWRKMMQLSPRRSPRLNDGQENVSATAQTDTSVLVPQRLAAEAVEPRRHPASRQV